MAIAFVDDVASVSGDDQNITPTLPTNSDGNTLAMFIQIDDSSGASPTISSGVSGWTLIFGGPFVNRSDHIGYLYMKEAGASETAPSIALSAASDGLRVLIASFSGVATNYSDFRLDTAGGFQSTANNEVKTFEPNTMLLSFATSDDVETMTNTAGGLTTFSSGWSTDDVTAQGGYLAVSAPSENTITWTIGGSESFGAITVAMQDATVTAPRLIDTQTDSATSGQTRSITLSESPQAGDMLRAFVYRNDAGTPDIVTPTGWAKRAGGDGYNTDRYAVFDIVECDGTEGTAHSFDLGKSARGSVIVELWRPESGVTFSFDAVTSMQSNASATTCDIPTITHAADAIVLAQGVFDSDANRFDPSDINGSGGSTNGDYIFNVSTPDQVQATGYLYKVASGTTSAASFDLDTANSTGSLAISYAQTGAATGGPRGRVYKGPFGGPIK